MKVRIEVRDLNGRPVGRFRPGAAFVYVDDKLVAKLRTGEGFEVESELSHVTRRPKVALPGESPAGESS